MRRGSKAKTEGKLKLIP